MEVSTSESKGLAIMEIHKLVKQDAGKLLKVWR